MAMVSSSFSTLHREENAEKFGALRYKRKGKTMSKNEENKSQADGQISSSDPLSFISPLLVRNA